jgi:hypothetical protein
MDLHKTNVKFFTEKGNDISLHDFIPVFHRWIQEDKLEGMLVDVTEYTHVFQGPGVLLIAHEANYSVDEMEGRRGFLYAQKRVPEGKPESHLKTAFRRALQGAALLEKEKEFTGKLKFATGHLQVTLNDRASATAGSASQAEFEKQLKPVLDSLYGAGGYSLSPEKDPKKLAGFEVKVNNNPEASALLAKLK